LIAAAAEDRAAEGTVDRECRGVPVIELEFAGKIVVRIPCSTPAELATAVVKALSRR
jgi:hypothetical protein